MSFLSWFQTSPAQVAEQAFFGGVGQVPASAKDSKLDFPAVVVEPTMRPEGAPEWRVITAGDERLDTNVAPLT